MLGMSLYVDDTLIIMEAIKELRRESRIKARCVWVKPESRSVL